MRHHLYKSAAMLPPADGRPERIRFEGMQDPALIISEASPVWEQIAADYLKTETAAGECEIDMSTVNTVMQSDHPEAQTVVQALYRLGAYH